MPTPNPSSVGEEGAVIPEHLKGASGTGIFTLRGNEFRDLGKV